MYLNRTFLSLTVFFLLSLQSLFAIRSNDFTKSNLSFASKYQSLDDYQKLNKESLINKSYPKEMFYNSKENSTLQNERAYVPTDRGVDDIQSKRYSNNPEFNVPDYSVEQRRYADYTKSAVQKNQDNNLTKNYIGKIDVNDRSVKEQTYIDEYYGKLKERSMQEINKYQFRSSHSSDPGINVQVAGSEGKEDSESWLSDLFSGTTRIKRNPVSLKGPTEKSALRPQKDIENNSAPKKIMAPVINNNSTSKTLTPSAQNNPSKRTVSEEDLNLNNTKSFLGLPQDMRDGQATITIEVQD